MESENSKRQLIFACEWYYNRKKSWSGTHISIFNALRKYYDVKDFNMGSGFIATAIEMISCRVGLSVQPAKHRRETASIRARKKFANTDTSIFQFGDTPDIIGCNSFVYQDLNWIFLEKLYRENFCEFQFSGFDRFSLEHIHTKALEQDEFYHKKNCVAILAMGHWYKNFLVNDCRLSQEKVYHIGGGAIWTPR